MKKQKETFQLKIPADKIPSENFVKIVDSCIGFLKETAQSVNKTGQKVTWLISVKKGSIILEAELAVTQPVTDGFEFKSFSSAVIEDVGMLEKSPKQPRYLSERALQHLQELSHQTKYKLLKGNLNLKLHIANKQIELSPKIEENIKHIAKTTRISEGSVEGILLLISGKGGTLHISVDDVLTGRSVRCNIKPEDLDKILSNFRRRVIVSGKVEYRADGQPNSVEMEELRVLGRREDLPSFDEMFGILRDEG